jgi:hypothetical protein
LGWNGAGDRIRTGDIDLGKVALYQLSYSRTCGAKDFKGQTHCRARYRESQMKGAGVVAQFEIEPLPGGSRKIQQIRKHRELARVRAFGEMVDLIWTSSPTATHHLEQLWNRVIEAHSVPLLCAYSLGGSRPAELTESLMACHSHAVAEVAL